MLKIKNAILTSVILVVMVPFGLLFIHCQLVAFSHQVPSEEVWDIFTLIFRKPVVIIIIIIVSTVLEFSGLGLGFIENKENENENNNNNLD